MHSLKILSNGLLQEGGTEPFKLNTVDAELVDAEHLVPQVLTFDVQGRGPVGIRVTYSCHCWTRSFDLTRDVGTMGVMDGKNKRVFSAERFDLSLALPALVATLDELHIYETTALRNHGAYNSSGILADGTAYTIFFTLRPMRGKMNKVRYRLVMDIESAYLREQPGPGRQVSFRSAVGSALDRAF